MKKSYLKPESDAWFYLQCMIFYNGYNGNGRKKHEKYIYTKNKEKIPRLVSLPSPVYKIGGLLFSGSKETGNKPDLP